MTTPYAELDGRAEIVSASGGDPFVSCFAGESARGYSADGAVVWNRMWNDTSAIMAAGPADKIASLISNVAPMIQPTRLTIPHDSLPLLPEAVRPTRVNHWHWFYTRTAPPQAPSYRQCSWMGRSDFEEITTLLTESFPHASVKPDPGRDDNGWFGARDDAGKIIACGHSQAGDGIGPMLGSITVHPDHRRKGLAAALTGWVTTQLLGAGNSMVALGSYAGEEATHRIYKRLGYRDVVQLASGRLTASN